MPYVLLVLVLIIVITLYKTAKIVPQKQAWIIERLGEYRQTLNAGLHILIPFIDKVAYQRDLKEMALDVPPQQCVTRDNITVTVDGILYLQVVDPVKASYGIQDYLYACSQLAQTTLRSEIGKLDLDRTFIERTSINSAICAEVDKASDPWGVKVTRYEIKTIEPPKSVKDAMEKQMRAEREKRAAIAESEGEKARRVNEAEGRAAEIRLVAEATAQGLREIAAATKEQGGMEAMNLRLAEQYIAEFGKIAKTGNTLVLPTDMANIAGFLKAATTVVKEVK